MDTTLAEILKITFYPAVIFACSFVPSLCPKLILSSRMLRRVFDKMTIVSAGLLLAILFTDFIPHMLGGCSHSQSLPVLSAHPKKIDAETYREHSTDGGAGALRKRAAAPHDHSTHAHCGAGHTHGHSNTFFGRMADHSHPGLLVAGLTFIFLIWIDVSVVKHQHCDKDSDQEIAPSRDGHRPHLHHSHSRDHSGRGKGEGAEIRSCCTEGLRYKTSAKQALIFILVFSIHSIFEGLAFGDSFNGEANVLLVGLIIHKILESITVGVALFASSFSLKTITGLLLFYSSLTPVGILLSSFFTRRFSSPIIKEIFNGMSFGSLSFIVLVEMLPPIFHSMGKSSKIYYLLSGYLVGSLAIAAAHA